MLQYLWKLLIEVLNVLYLILSVALFIFSKLTMLPIPVDIKVNILSAIIIINGLKHINRILVEFPQVIECYDGCMSICIVKIYICQAELKFVVKYELPASNSK